MPTDTPPVNEPEEAAAESALQTERNLDLENFAKREAVRMRLAEIETSCEHDYERNLSALAQNHLRGALDCIDELLDELQAADHHAMSLAKALSITRQQLNETETAHAEAARYARVYYRCEELAGALVTAAHTPEVESFITGSDIDVNVGMGSYLTATIRCFSKYLELPLDCAALMYVLRPGGGYSLDSAVCDDTALARQYLARAQRISMALISHPLVYPLLADENGNVRVGPASP